MEANGFDGSAVIAISKMQRDMIYRQLGIEVPLIIELERHDTFPAISLAASYLYTVENMTEEETVVVLSVIRMWKTRFFNE